MRASDGSRGSDGPAIAMEVHHAFDNNFFLDSTWRLALIGACCEKIVKHTENCAADFEILKLKLRIAV